MFRNRSFYDEFTESIVSLWVLYAWIGVSLMLSAILIFAFPELLAYLVAVFLLFNGILFLGLAWRTKKLRRQYHSWVDAFWEP